MKIPSVNTEVTEHTLDQQDINSTADATSLNEAIFNQLIQLLMNLPESSLNESTENGQTDVEQIENENKLIQAVGSNVPENSLDVSEWLDKIKQSVSMNDEASTQTVHEIEELINQLKNNESEPTENQAKALGLLVNKMNYSKEPLQLDQNKNLDSLSVQNDASSFGLSSISPTKKLTDQLDQNDDGSQNNQQKEAQNFKMKNLMADSHSQIEEPSPLALMSNEALKSSGIQSTSSSFDRMDELNVDQASKYKDAFIQLGQFINNQTNQLYQSNQTSKFNQTPASLSNQEFNPLYDLKFDVTSNIENTHLKESYDATIKIYPPELGFVTAKLKMDKNNVELMILTENNQVKHIIESNLSSLKQYFQQADVTLGQVDVQTRDTTHQQGSSYSDKENTPNFVAENKEYETKQTKLPKNKSENTIIDTYA